MTNEERERLSKPEKLAERDDGVEVAVGLRSRREMPVVDKGCFRRDFRLTLHRSHFPIYLRDDITRDLPHPLDLNEPNRPTRLNHQVNLAARLAA